MNEEIADALLSIPRTPSEEAAIRKAQIKLMELLGHTEFIKTLPNLSALYFPEGTNNQPSETPTTTRRET